MTIKLQDLKSTFTLDTNPLMAGAKLAMAGIGALVATVGLATVAIKGSVDKTIKWADELDALQDVTDLTNDQVSGLNILLRKHKVDADTAAKSLTFLNKNLVDYDGSLLSAGKSLKNYGIDVKNSNGELKNNADLLQEVANKYAMLPAGAERVKFATDVLGKSGAELNDVLLNMAEKGMASFIEQAKRLGLNIDSDKVQAYKQSVEEMKLTWEAFQISAGSKVIPILEQLQKVGMKILNSEAFQTIVDGILGGLEGVGTWIESNAPEWETKIDTALTNAKTVIENVKKAVADASYEWEHYKKNVTEVMDLENQGLKPANLDTISTFEGLAIAVGVDVVTAWKDLKAIGKDILDIFTKLSGASDTHTAKMMILSGLLTPIANKFMVLAKTIRDIRTALDWVKEGIEDGTFLKLLASIAKPISLSIVGTGTNSTKRASGGATTAGQLYDVTEFNKPETFSPAVNGRISPTISSEQILGALRELLNKTPDKHDIASAVRDAVLLGMAGA